MLMMKTATLEHSQEKKGHLFIGSCEAFQSKRSGLLNLILFYDVVYIESMLVHFWCWLFEWDTPMLYASKKRMLVQRKTFIWKFMQQLTTYISVMLIYPFLCLNAYCYLSLKYQWWPTARKTLYINLFCLLMTIWSI